MSLSPRLTRKLHQTLGEEAAEDLVNWMQQVDSQRHEVRELKEAIRADFGELRQEMHAGFGQLREQIHGVEATLEKRTADLMKWSFVFWVGAVSAIAVLAGVLR